MPRPRQPPRLAWRPERGEPGQPGHRAGSWTIRDGSTERRLGLGRGDRAEADRQLALWIAAQTPKTGKAQAPADLLIADALRLYGDEHAPTTADPARIGHAILALLPHWRGRTVDAVDRRACRAYAAARSKQGIASGTIRRELGCLSTALRWCVAEGYLTAAPVVSQPPRPPGRERSLERGEIAALIRAARSSPRTRHLARFILVAYYTGTRPGATCRLRWSPSLAGGHVDLARGVLYRRPPGTAETRKRQPPIRIPSRLLLHLRRWRREDEAMARRAGLPLGAIPIVHFYGRPVGKFRSSWGTVRAVAGLGADVVPHTLRHTSITHACQGGADPWEVCGFYGISMEELQRTYLHHHPSHQGSVGRALGRL